MIRFDRLTLVALLGSAALTTMPLAARADIPGSDRPEIARAQAAFTQDKLQEAVIELKNLLKKDPKNAAGRLLLADVYLKAGQGAAAEQELLSAQKAGIKPADLRLKLGKSYLLQGKFQDAIDRINPTGDDFKANAAQAIEGHLLVGQAYLGLRDPDKAEAAYKQILAAAPKDAHGYIGLGRVAVMRKDLTEAESQVDKALSLDPRSVEALLVKGQLRHSARDNTGALGYFTSAVSADPKNVGALLERASLLTEMGQADKAKVDIDEILKQAPNHPLAIYLDAWNMARQGQYDKADAQLQKVGRQLDKFMPYVLLRGMVDFAQNKMEQAVFNLQRYMEVNPGNPLARRALGAALLRKGDASKALEMLRPLEGQADNDLKLLQLLGSVYSQTGDYEKGEEFFSKAAALDPKSAELGTKLAVSKLAQGQTGEAVAELEKITSGAQNSVQASTVLALVELRNRNFDKAIEAAQGIKKADPKSPLAENLIGAAWLGKGDMAKARKSFEAALVLAPKYFPAVRNLAQLDVRDNKPDAARKRFENILQSDPKHIGAMLALGQMAIAQKDLKKGISWFEKAEAADPKAIEPMVQLVNAYMADHNTERALATASQLANLYPNNKTALETLGRAQGASGDNQNAVATFSKLVDKAPDSIPALYMLAVAQNANKDVRGAKDSLSKILALDPNHLGATADLITLNARMKNYDDALKLASDLRTRQPKLDRADILTGDVYAAMGRWNDALTSYKSAQAKQASGLAALRIFVANRNLGNFQAGFDALEGWLTAAPKDLEARSTLANAYLQAGRFDNAVKQYEIMVQASPDNPALLNNLAWAYQKMNSPKALSTAQAAVKLRPDEAAIIDTLGWIYLQQNRPKDALPLLQKASSKATDSPEIRYHYAQALMQTGDRKGALREVQAALAMGRDFSEINVARTMQKDLLK